MYYSDEQMLKNSPKQLAELIACGLSRELIQQIAKQHSNCADNCLNTAVENHEYESDEYMELMNHFSYHNSIAECLKQI